MFSLHQFTTLIHKCIQSSPINKNDSQVYSVFTNLQLRFISVFMAQYYQDTIRKISLCKTSIISVLVVLSPILTNLKDRFAIVFSLPNLQVRFTSVFCLQQFTSVFISFYHLTRKIHKYI